MSQRIPWIDSALLELEGLARRHAERSLDPASAFRVLALSTRVNQARAAGRDVALPEPLRVLAEAVKETARAPRRDGVLARLDALLAATGDPFGELLDVLLDIDDMVSVDEARGHEATAHELVQLATAYVSLHPVRVGALGGLAEARLVLLPELAAIRELWDLVARAAGMAAVEALEPLTPAPPLSVPQRRLAQRLQAARGMRIQAEISRTPVMEWLVAPAAATQAAMPEASEDDEDVGVYLEDEQVVVNVRLPPGREAAGSIEVRVEARERTVTWTVSDPLVSRRAVIARLGTAMELRGRLAREGVSVSAGGIRFFVSLALKERRDDTR